MNGMLNSFLKVWFGCSSVQGRTSR